MAWLFLIVVCGIATFFNLDLWMKQRSPRDILVHSSRVARTQRRIKNFCVQCLHHIKNFFLMAMRLCTKSSNLLLVVAGVLIFFSLIFFGFDMYKLYIELSAEIRGNKNITIDYYGISIRYFGIVAAAGTVIGYIIAINRNIAANNQNKINQQGQITESMVQAISQIGKFNGKTPNIEVRLGGLYSLQLIMQNSPSHEEAIARIFYAYVRENAKIDKANKQDPPMREDVQAALDIIGKFNRMWQKQGKEIVSYRRINLSRTNLVGYYIAGINFSYAILEDVDLSGADLLGAGLNGNRFSYAVLVGSNLSGLDLSFGNLSNADLCGANLSGADLSVTQMIDADLSGADLSSIKSYEANLFGAILEDTILSGAELVHANLSESHLKNANLSNADLSGSDFYNAYLSDADLSDAILTEADFSRAYLATAKNLTQKQINQAKGDSTTILPEKLERPAHWNKKTKKIKNPLTKS